MHLNFFRTEALATEIFNDCGNEPLICLCVLKGGYKFFADLTERIQNRNRTNGNKSLPMMIDFIRLKSYHVIYLKTSDFFLKRRNFVNKQFLFSEY